MNNRVHRARFDNLRHQWKILLMSSAVVHGQRAFDESIRIEVEEEMDAIRGQGQTPETHYIFTHQTDYDRLSEKMLAIEEAGRKALENEDYESMKLLHKTYEVLKKKRDNLKR